MLLGVCVVSHFTAWPDASYHYFWASLAHFCLPFSASVLWYKSSLMLVAETSCSPLQTTRGYPLTPHCPSTLNQIYALFEEALPYALLCYFFQRGNLIEIRWMSHAKIFPQKQLCKGREPPKHFNLGSQQKLSNQLRVTCLIANLPPLKSNYKF